MTQPVPQRTTSKQAINTLRRRENEFIITPRASSGRDEHGELIPALPTYQQHLLQVEVSDGDHHHHEMSLSAVSLPGNIRIS